MLNFKNSWLAVSRLPLVRTLITSHTYRPIRNSVSFNPIPPSSLAQRNPNQLAGRKFLPGSWSKTFPKFLANPREGFPHALQVETADNVSTVELGKLCREKLNTSLPRSGAVLFRGTGIERAQDFSELVQGLGYQATSYEGGTGNRHEVDPIACVYTSTDDPMEYSNELHNEMACSTIHPRKVIFCCLKPPAAKCGGLTPISNNKEIFESLDPEVVTILQDRKIRYLRYLPDACENKYTSWQQSFMTSDKQVVDDFLQKAGFNFKWNPSNNSLFYWYVLDPLVPHPVTGRPVWFNQVNVHHNTYYKESPMFDGMDLPNHMYPTHTTYGDGSEIEPEVIQHIRDINWSKAVGFDWQEGDVIVIDNILAMHGRLSFSGERRILAHLTRN